MTNKIIKFLIVATPIVFVLAIVIGISFGYMQYSQTQEGANPLTTACYNVSFSEDFEGISINTAIPISDEDGLKTEPYKMTITNNCSKAMTINVLLNIMNTSTTTDSYIKVAYNDTPSLLTDNKKVDANVTNAKHAYIIGQELLKSKQSVTINLKSWLADSVVDNQAENTQLVSKLSISLDSSSLAARILNNNTLQTSTPNFAYGAPNTTLTSNASGLFSAADDLGTSYYFRGNITNNYVSFGGFIWRVVRINGDGTIRMVYDGTTAHTNGEDSTDRYVGTSAFNTSYNDPKYVGYTYDNTYDENGFVTRETDSTMKTYLDDWYQTNIVDNNLDGYVAESIYCNDTTTSSTSGSTIYYGADGRIYKTSDNAPILTCPTTDKDYGGKYKLKVGLLSADEMAMAGLGYSSTNYYATTDNYIYLNTYWYSMSPRFYTASFAYVDLGSQGRIHYSIVNVTAARAVRPVINLRADTIITNGDGTKDNPYIVG